MMKNDIESLQGRGLGRKLVRSLCQYGESIGCKEIWVATEQSNIAARKAYIAAGGIEDKEPVVLITFNQRENGPYTP